ncbi:MAG: polyketide cyclase [Sphingobacteriales bacterium]|nr:MAG: polyketide cyclase [Sphingobacteriales bacterium]
METVIIIIVAVLALPFIIALFLPKEYGVERSIVINAPKHEVFDYIKYIKNQDYYNKWVMTDPNMQKTFTGTDGTVGFIYAWNGNSKGGEGKHEITGIADGDRLNTEIRFVRPLKSVGHTHMVTEALTEHSTKVTWGMTGKSPYPLNLMTTLMKGVLGKDLDVSLNNLKRILEK